MTTTTINAQTTCTINGEIFESPYSDAQAFVVCQGIQSDFAQSLTSRPLHRLSDKQVAWLHKLAINSVPAYKAHFFPQTVRQAVTIEIDADFAGKINAVFAKASTKLKYPKVRLSGDSGEIVLKPRNGVVYINDAVETTYNSYRGETTPVFYGKIENGVLISPKSGTPDWVIELVKAFANDPIGTAVAYGRATGNCCFCGRELTAGESIERGYGPICAENYGLA